MSEKKQFETCITVEFCHLNLMQGYQIGQDLDLFLQDKNLGYYYGSTRQQKDGSLCFKFFLHVPSKTYPKALAAIARKLIDPDFFPGGRIITSHSWLIRSDRNTELYSRILGLVKYTQLKDPVNIDQPESIAYALSGLSEDKMQIREPFHTPHFQHRPEANQVLVCL